jgi:hypothetical protein
MAGQRNLQTAAATSSWLVAARISPSWSGYPLPGCSSAEPGSVSPNRINLHTEASAVSGRTAWPDRFLRLRIHVATENDPDLDTEAARAPTIARVNGGVLRMEFHDDGACADLE